MCTTSHLCKYFRNIVSLGQPQLSSEEMDNIIEAQFPQWFKDNVRISLPFFSLSIFLNRHLQVLSTNDRGDNCFAITFIWYRCLIPMCIMMNANNGCNNWLRANRNCITIYRVQGTWCAISYQNKKCKHENILMRCSG